MSFYSIEVKRRKYDNPRTMYNQLQQCHESAFRNVAFSEGRLICNGGHIRISMNEQVQVLANEGYVQSSLISCELLLFYRFLMLQCTLLSVFVLNKGHMLSIPATFSITNNSLQLIIYSNPSQLAAKLRNTL